MKLIKRLFIGLGIVLLLVLGGSQLLPATVHVDRSVVIEASAEEVFSLVNSFERFNAWSPWAARDPDAKYVYSGPKQGVGARMSWTSEDPKVGNGSQEILKSERPRLVQNALVFGEDESEQALASFNLVPEGEGVKVTWDLDSKLGMNPIARIFGLFMDSLIGPDYEKGLASLKTLAEAEASAKVTAAAIEVPTEPDAGADAKANATP